MILFFPQLDTKGRVVIPAWIRKRLQISPGDTFKVLINDNRVELLRLHLEGSHD